MIPTKESLRAKIRQLLGSQSLEDRKRRSLKIQKKLFSLALFKRSKCVCFYVSLPSEVDTTGMIDQALQIGKRVLVPRTNLENKELSLYEIKNRERDLTKGAHGIMEPLVVKTRLGQIHEVDCLVIPGVVFDKKNHRVGHGKGYYDRFLQRFGPEILKIGLAFSFQIVQRIPIEDHDVPVDIVLTD